ncbi:MAG: hypothetical protein ABII20_02640 [Candidatus Omnitrophota bacterium]|nr:hypothetical protein [bacterium]MBU3930479.1 hypothetical protein [bacterium]
MTENQKTELTPQQINLLLQIINKGTYVGEQVEIVTHLKQTLIAMLKEKQSGPPKPKEKEQ